jgi:prepilin-type N-terminal cleavage/methylation domain-containing protein
MRQTGFTLVELMIAAAVTSVALLGLLGVFSGCFGVDESARDLTAAMNAARHSVEEMRTLRDQGIPRAPGHYSEVDANWAIAHSIAVDIIDDGTDPDTVSSPQLHWISVSVTWMQQGGRIYGEDNGEGAGTALDGNINGAEDVNNSGILDSPAQIITLMRQ